MKRNYLLLMALLPGLFLASCAPEANNAEPAVEDVVEEAPPVEVEETLPNVEATDAPEADEEAAEPAEPVEATQQNTDASAGPPMDTDAAALTAAASVEKAEWMPLFNGENLEGWTPRGAATWEVVDGVIVGKSEGGQGHLYADPVLTDLEVKGMFRISSQGRDANSGLYFRANPPADNPDGYPEGYEAQICHTQDAHTGWLWKPGTPTGEATKLLTEDGEWFPMRVRAIGPNLEIWVKDELVMTYKDSEYTKGQFAIQCHNEEMTVEAKDLQYRDLSGGEN